MTLIDADALKRRAITVRFFGKDIMMVPTAEIDDAPTIDAVEVVRCKDCKHYIVEGIATQYGWCHEYKHSVDEDDYCSYGERKGGDTE